MALTLHFLDGDIGRICDTGSVKAAACGGRLPYTWTISNPNATFVSNDPVGGNPDCCNVCTRGHQPLSGPPPPGSQGGGPTIRSITITISAPTNLNPGYTGTAGEIRSFWQGLNCFKFNACYFFGCDGVVDDPPGCTAVGCMSCDPDACSPGCPSSWCNPLQCGACDSPSYSYLPQRIDNCAAVLEFSQYVCDLRTQEQKDAGCMPCAAEMANVVVTVTDADGNSVSRILKV